MVTHAKLKTKLGRTKRSTTNPTALVGRRLDWRRERGRSSESTLSRSDWVCLNVRFKNEGSLDHTLCSRAHLGLCLPRFRDRTNHILLRWSEFLGSACSPSRVPFARWPMHQRPCWIPDLVGMAAVLQIWHVSAPLFPRLPCSSRNLVAGRSLGHSRTGCATPAAKLGVSVLGSFESSCVCRMPLLARH